MGFLPQSIWNLTRPGVEPIFPAFSSVQSLSHVWLFVTPWITARASLSITNSWSFPRPTSIESVMPSNHLILCCPFFCLQPFPASGYFQMSQPFALGGQRIGVSASTSVLELMLISSLISPMNTQDWSSLGWTGWISLHSKGLSRVEKVNFKLFPRQAF